MTNISYQNHNGRYFVKIQKDLQKKTSSPEKSVRTLSSPEKFTKQSNSVSSVKDSEVNRKRLPDSPTKEGELTHSVLPYTELK